MPFSFSASMTRWNPSVSSAAVSPTLCSSVADIIFYLCVLPASLVVRPGHSVEKIAVLLDMFREPHGVLSYQSLGEISVVPLQPRNNIPMIHDRPLRPVVLRHRHRADCAHVDEQVVGQSCHQL